MVPFVPFDFQSVSIWINLAIFAAAAIVVWQAGTRLSRYADVVAERTGLGHAFVGLVMLAFATSLPELATTMTASVSGNAALAVNNLLGGIVLQTVVLALADLVVGGNAITYLATRASLLLQASLLIALLGLTLTGSATGVGFSLAQVSIWPAVIFAVYLLAVYLEHVQRGQDNWTPVNQPEEAMDRDSMQKINQQAYVDRSTRVVIGFFAAAGVAILVAGIVLARVSDALAVQSGLGASFVGATLLAASTSLPEVSTTIGAVRVGANGMAISNVFGSNMLMVAFLFLADLSYREGEIMSAIGATERFALSMGIAVTAVYLVGLIERRNRTLLRMGLDSVAVLLLYAGTLAGLYFIGG